MKNWPKVLLIDTTVNSGKNVVREIHSRSPIGLTTEFRSDGVVKCDKLLSHQVSLSDVQKAFELAATPGNYKVSLIPN